MPACTTSLLRLLVSTPNRSWRSRMTTARPRSARARAHASPTTPAPMTTASASMPPNIRLRPTRDAVYSSRATAASLPGAACRRPRGLLGGAAHPPHRGTSPRDRRLAPHARLALPAAVLRPPRRTRRLAGDGKGRAMDRRRCRRRAGAALRRLDHLAAPHQRRRLRRPRLALAGVRVGPLVAVPARAADAAP